MSNKPMRVTGSENELIRVIRFLKLDPGTITAELFDDHLNKKQEPAANIKFKPIDSSKRVIPRS